MSLDGSSDEQAAAAVPVSATTAAIQRCLCMVISFGFSIDMHTRPAHASEAICHAQESGTRICPWPAAANGCSGRALAHAQNTELAHARSDAQLEIFTARAADQD